MTDKPEKPKTMDVDALLTEVTGSIATGKTVKIPVPEPKAAKAAKEAPKEAPKETPKEKTMIRIRQVRSGICAPEDQKQALVGLGLRRIRQVVVRQDSESTRGQILKVRHLVEVVAE